MTEPNQVKKEEKALSFDEQLEKNAVIAIVILICFVMLGFQIAWAVIFSILITLYLGHLRGKK